LLSDLSLSEPEDTGLVEGVTDIFDILGVSICERLIVAANEAWEEVKEEIEDNRCLHCDEVLIDPEEGQVHCDDCKGYLVCEKCGKTIFPDDDLFDECDVMPNTNQCVCPDCMEEDEEDGDEEDSRE
jgi:hypothetical protein